MFDLSADAHGIGQHMKIVRILTSLFFRFCSRSHARAEKVSLVGATVINPADGKVLPNATVVINGDKIERVSMGKQDAATLGKQSQLRRQIYSAGLHRHARALLSIG